MYSSKHFEWFAMGVLLTLFLGWWERGNPWALFLALLSPDSYPPPLDTSLYRLLLPLLCLLMGLLWALLGRRT